MKSIAYGAMDVHTERINVAVVPPLVSQEAAVRLGQLGMMQEYDPDRIIEERCLANTKTGIQRYVRRLAETYDIHWCYEASSCGYVIYRWLKEIGADCEVIAPSKIPRRPGERIKTDRLDALKLARYYRSGHLITVHAPTVEEEADRSLVRFRTALVHDITCMKNRILRVLDRQGVRYQEGKSKFTQQHRRFLKGIHFTGGEEYAYRQYLTLLDLLELHQADADHKVQELAESGKYAPAVGKLGCMRGIAGLSAMVLITETFDFTRFAKADQLMGYWGFGVCEDTSADQRRQGGITKAGNEHCRWILVEAAKHYKHAPAISEELKRRQAGQPPEVIDHAWKAQQRLHKTYWKVLNNTGCANKAAVAVAREASGFVWAIMTDRCGACPTDTE